MNKVNANVYFLYLLNNSPLIFLILLAKYYIGGNVVMISIPLSDENVTAPVW